MTLDRPAARADDFLFSIPPSDLFDWILKKIGETPQQTQIERLPRSREVADGGSTSRNTWLHRLTSNPFRSPLSSEQLPRYAHTNARYAHTNAQPKSIGKMKISPTKLIRKSKRSNTEASQPNDQHEQLASLRAEFEEYKRSSTAERDTLTSERDALSSERDALAKEVVSLKEKSKESTLQDENETVDESSKESRTFPFAQHALDSVAEKVDEDGYMKCCLAQE